MARDDPQVNLRLPVSLKNRLEQTAEKNQRAFKAEIVARLEAFDELETEAEKQTRYVDVLEKEIDLRKEELAAREGEIERLRRLNETKVSPDEVQEIERERDAAIERVDELLEMLDRSTAMNSRLVEKFEKQLEYLIESLSPAAKDRLKELGVEDPTRSD